MFVTSVMPNNLDAQIKTRNLFILFQGTPKRSMEADKLKIRAAPLPASRDLMVSQFLLTFQVWPSSELFFLLFYIHNLSCHSQNVHNREITFGFMHVCVPSWPHAATEKSLAKVLMQDNPTKDWKALQILAAAILFFLSFVHRFFPEEHM